MALQPIALNPSMVKTQALYNVPNGNVRIEAGLVEEREAEIQHSDTDR